MGDSTLTLVLAFVAAQVAQVLAFARFYLNIRKDLKVSVEQVKQTAATMQELRDIVADPNTTPTTRKAAGRKLADKTVDKVTAK